MTFFQIGNLTVSSVWVAVLIAALLTAGLYRFILKDRLGGWFSDAIFYYIMIWKFSYMIFQFPLFIDQPLGALYFNGGRQGHLLAIIAITVLLWYKMKKENIRPLLLPVSLLFYFLYKASYYGVEQQWLQLFGQLVVIIMLVTLLKNHRNVMTAQIYTAFFVVQLLVISLEQALFSVESVTFSWLFLFGLVNLNIWRKPHYD